MPSTYQAVDAGDCALLAEVYEIVAHFGPKSGRAMVEALIAGETNPVKLACLVDRRVKGWQDEPSSAKLAST